MVQSEGSGLMRTLSRVLIYSLNQVRFRLDARISAILPKQQQKLAIPFTFELDKTNSDTIDFRKINIFVNLFVK